MSKTLRDVLNQFRTLENVELAAVAGTDGLLIESSARSGVDVDAICAVASNGLAMAEALGREINKGGSVQTVLEYDQGLILLEPVSSDAMLVVLTSSRELLGKLRYMAQAHRAHLDAALAAI
ncbi:MULTISPECIES: roadblock/LC7 domain-containing protein [Herpetosiphon]|uniref:Dynein regulation protein LC7 n=1 Tax=Herpetosiphon geysericola TaxID=70996 RepID=A0A0P6YG44_9CHLR|nr:MULTISPECIES: roadblock/LC7 domain-containing protein [Herpetosiphon]KPL91152.1 dynein regulation protein LC7 [Herpetosiphon geysericola]MBM7845277.1 putative regulator of Ras-like GTPase activity (Roadblock/LC7/MglB family) [Herpetosiphon giganteus]